MVRSVGVVITGFSLGSGDMTQIGGMGLYWMSRRTSRARSTFGEPGHEVQRHVDAGAHPGARDQVAVVDEARVDVGDDGGI